MRNNESDSDIVKGEIKIYCATGQYCATILLVS